MKVLKIRGHASVGGEYIPAGTVIAFLNDLVPC
jgi:hypothetical protein